MKVKVKHIISEAKHSYEMDGTTTLDGHELTLDVEYSRDGRDWGRVCSMHKWMPGCDKPNGTEVAQAVQGELQARVDNADDKIEALRAIRAEGS